MKEETNVTIKVVGNKSDIQKNIDLLREIRRNGLFKFSDKILLMDTISLLEGIQKGLPNR